MLHLALGHDHQLCDAFRTLRERFEWLAQLASGSHASPLCSALCGAPEVRPDVVTFCRIANARGVHGVEVRRQVGRAMREALSPTCEACGEATLRLWERAVSRLVDEIYLCGEHRDSP
jgi:hypothetical protein